MKNEECIKNNICPMCDGKIYFNLRKTGQIKCTCEDGTYVGHLLNWEIKYLKDETEKTKKDYIELQEWVKKTSTCKTCGGDQKKTWGLFNCEECGIPGIGYWPG